MKLKFTLSNTAILLVFLFSVGSSWSQLSYTLTSCGATGSAGPTQAQATATYSSTSVGSSVTVTGGIQYWTVPTTGTYRITAMGAQGGGAQGGLGASMQGDFVLTQGQVIRILVGQQGETQSGNPNSVGGGGGTFVVANPALTSADILIIAGGGGGSASNAYVTRHGNSGTSGNNGQIDAGVANPNGIGGINGNGGSKSVTGCSLDRGSGGGGFLTNGESICQSVGVGNGGNSFLNGGLGGTGTGPGATGGFGGGGATWQTGFRGSGGGGGYSGGGAGQINSVSPNHAGGGGGSFNAGLMQNNLSGINSGNGMVTIESLTSVPNDAGITNILGFSPACTGTYPIQAVANNLGSNLISSLTVGWSINGVIQTPFTLTTPLDTVNGVGPNSQTVTLGNALIDGSTVIRAWTYLPNNVVDTVNGNDTTSISFTPMQVVPNFLSGINCNGGTNGVVQAGVINNAGGTMTYSWSTGINGNLLVGIGAGTYVLTGSNGTCTDTASFVMTHPPAIAYSDATTGVSCFGDSTGTSTLTISGGTPGYTVSWAAGGTGLTNNALPGGMNAFTITDNNSCQVTGSVNVTQPTALNLTSAVTPETLGSDGAVDLTVTGGTPGYTYLWSNAATTQDLSGLNSGTFNVTVTDANGCTSTLSAVVNSVVGINEKSDDFGISIYPNPSNGHFTVALANGDKNTSIEVFDVLGKKVFGKVNPSSNTKIELNVHNGVYLVKVTNGSNSYLERIVVKN
jgi:hypothetical protein